MDLRVLTVRLLIVNFATDPRDPLLGFTTEWARRISSHFEDSLVLSGRVGPKPPSDMKIRSLGWKQGRSLSNLVRLEYRFTRELRAFRPDVIFVHMAAAYAAFIGPIARAHSVPLVLWYEHQATSWELRLAETWASAVVSASSAYPGHSAPVVVGHGIDPDSFGPVLHDSYPPGEGLSRAIHVGRADGVKRVERLLRAIEASRRASNVNYQFTQLGDRTGSCDSVEEGLFGSGLPASTAPWVQWHASVPRAEVPLWLKDNDFFVHAYGGAIDKAPLEASIAGLPVLSEGTHVYAALGGKGSPPPLEQQMAQLRQMSGNDVRGFVRWQQEHVMRHHALPGTAERIAAVLKSQVDRRD